jgi:tetratricopeptide (TPR) repeat protein
MAYKYKAFISYSWADKEWGSWLHRALETYRTPAGLVGKETAKGPAPARLHPIFKDREEEAAGASIGASIEAAMRESEFLIVLCSPRSAKSRWVNREVAWFKTHREPKNILALIVDGEPLASLAPGREDEECFPRALLFKVGPDLQPTEIAEDAPLAADARDAGDGKRGAKLKLAAAMLGLGLDDLVRRDDRRRQARRRLVTGASLGVSAAMAFLAFDAMRARDAALIARNDAVAAQGIAETERGRAVKARDDAEGLIELILTDLKSDLEGYGTLKSVTQIGNRAIGYYEGQDVKALSPDQLGRRARVLLMLGEADNKRGDLDAALARYLEAAKTTEEQLARDPKNAQRIFDHAQSVFWVGYIAWQRGDHAKAKAQFTEYHDLAQKLVAIEPENDDYQAELEYAFSNLGTLAMDQGEAAQAERYFRESLNVSIGLHEKHAGDADRVLAVGQSYAWLADAAYLQGKAAEAARLRASEADLYLRNLDVSQNAKIARAALVSKYSLALAELAQGHIETALLEASIAAGELHRMLGSDPGNAVLADRAAYALCILAQAQFYQGDWKAALASAADARSLIDDLVRRSNDVTSWRGNIRADSILMFARIEFGRTPDAARKVVEELQADLRVLIDSGVADVDVLRRYAATLAFRARMNPGFEEGWTEIIERLGRDEAKRSPEARVLLAEAYHRTDRAAEARGIVERLYAAGYRHPDFMALLDAEPELKSAAIASAGAQ